MHGGRPALQQGASLTICNPLSEEPGGHLVKYPKDVMKNFAVRIKDRNNHGPDHESAVSDSCDDAIGTDGAFLLTCRTKMKQVLSYISTFLL